jgi:LDH2 family malate/lactate/ureidoglycolate dehydrogenase
MAKRKDHQMNVRIPSELVDELRRRKDAEGVNMDKQIENALRAHFASSEKKQKKVMCHERKKMGEKLEGTG